MAEHMFSSGQTRRLTLGSKVAGKHVREIKQTLSGQRLKFQCLACLLDPPTRAVLFYVTPTGWTNQDPLIQIPPGAFTFAFYWSDRRYNVYHWLDPRKTTIGFYFNAAGRTVIDHDGVEWEDLELDYWLDDEGHSAFIDEEKVPPELQEQVAQIKKCLVEAAPTVAAQVREETSQLFPTVFSNSEELSSIVPTGVCREQKRQLRPGSSRKSGSSPTLEVDAILREEQNR